MPAKITSMHTKIYKDAYMGFTSSDSNIDGRTISPFACLFAGEKEMFYMT